MRILIATCSIVILTLACAAPSGPPNRTDAIGICEKFVRDELRSPSTARFSSDQETGAFDSENGYHWRIKGWVDSQNALGATMRADYDCSVRSMGRSGSSLNWTRENVTVTPR